MPTLPRRSETAVNIESARRDEEIYRRLAARRAGAARHADANRRVVTVVAPDRPLTHMDTIRRDGWVGGTPAPVVPYVVPAQKFVGDLGDDYDFDYVVRDDRHAPGRTPF